jgi:hypothetical protein
MSKGKSIRRSGQNKPAKTLKEKKQAKREKREKKQKMANPKILSSWWLHAFPR